MDATNEQVNATNEQVNETNELLNKLLTDPMDTYKKWFTTLLTVSNQPPPKTVYGYYTVNEACKDIFTEIMTHTPTEPIPYVIDSAHTISVLYMMLQNGYLTFIRDDIEKVKRLFILFDWNAPMYKTSKTLLSPAAGLAYEQVYYMRQPILTELFWTYVVPKLNVDNCMAMITVAYQTNKLVAAVWETYDYKTDQFVYFYEKEIEFFSNNIDKLAHLAGGDFRCPPITNVTKKTEFVSYMRLMYLLFSKEIQPTATLIEHIPSMLYFPYYLNDYTTVLRKYTINVSNIVQLCNNNTDILRHHSFLRFLVLLSGNDLHQVFVALLQKYAQFPEKIRDQSMRLYLRNVVWANCYILDFDTLKQLYELLDDKYKKELLTAKNSFYSSFDILINIMKLHITGKNAQLQTALNAEFTAFNTKHTTQSFSCQHMNYLLPPNFAFQVGKFFIDLVMQNKIALNAKVARSILNFVLTVHTHTHCIYRIPQITECLSKICPLDKSINWFAICTNVNTSILFKAYSTQHITNCVDCIFTMINESDSMVFFRILQMNLPQQITTSVIERLTNDPRYAKYADTLDRLGNNYTFYMV